MNAGIIDPRWLWDYDDEGERWFMEIAAKRDKLIASTNVLVPGQNIIGAAGECCFSVSTGLPVDEERRLGGDDGRDFVYAGQTIDVKTSSFLVNTFLAVPVDKVRCDYYVLAKYDPANRRVWCAGWQYGTIIRQYPIGNLSKRGPVSYLVPEPNLHPMKDFVVPVKKNLTPSPVRGTR